MVVSGIASHEYNWRASFWVLTVIYVIFTALTVWTVPKDNFQRTLVDREAFRKFDIPRMGLIVAGFFSLFSSSLSLVLSFLIVSCLVSALLTIV